MEGRSIQAENRTYQFLLTQIGLIDAEMEKKIESESKEPQKTSAQEVADFLKAKKAPQIEKDFFDKFFARFIKEKPRFTSEHIRQLATPRQFYCFMRELVRKPLDKEEKQQRGEALSPYAFFLSIFAYVYEIGRRLDADKRQQAQFYQDVARELYQFAHPLVVFYGSWEKALAATKNLREPIEDVLRIAALAGFIEKQLYIIEKKNSEKFVTPAWRDFALDVRQVGSGLEHPRDSKKINEAFHHKTAGKIFRNNFFDNTLPINNLYEALVHVIACTRFMNGCILDAAKLKTFHYEIAKALDTYGHDQLQKYGSWLNLIICDRSKVEAAHRVAVVTDMAEMTTYLFALGMFMLRHMSSKEGATIKQISGEEGIMKKQAEKISYFIAICFLLRKLVENRHALFGMWKRSVVKKADFTERKEFAPVDLSPR